MRVIFKYVVTRLKCQHTHTHTHTHTHGCLDFVWDNPGEPVPEETFTHSHPSWSSIIPYLLLPSNAIHGILPVQSTRLTVFFHNLCTSFLWSTSWPGTLHFILHTFLHPVIVIFSQHVPISLQPVLLQHAHTHTRARTHNRFTALLDLVRDCTLTQT